MGFSIPPIIKAIETDLSNIFAPVSNIPLWSNLHGKPHITVSARGISNGQSEIFNDGADFGPDTPGTMTSGIQEAIDYVLSLSLPDALPFPEIFLLPGNFIINDNATIWLNNNPNSSSPYNPTGLHIKGVSEDLYTCAIIKQNSLPSPIISFTNPFGYTPTGFTPTGMTFENFSVLYQGSSSNATSGITMVNLSIPEIGGTMTVFKNLQIISSNPINNTLLDISGHEDSTADNILVRNAGGSYNSSITTPSLKAYMLNGNLNMYRVMSSGIDVEAQNANIINSTIGTGAGQGIIFRPTVYGATLNLQGTYFNGTLTRLITISPTTSGATYSGQVNLESTLLSKTPTENGDYMITPNSDIPITWDLSNALLINNNTADSLYLFDPSISTNDEYISVYTHSTNNSSKVILPTESSVSGTTAGTLSMQFIAYQSNWKKLIIKVSGYENDTTTNQVINFPLPFFNFLYSPANITGLGMPSFTNSSATITAPDSTTTYSGIIIFEGY